jgi:hydrocephalus-inducing protein
MNVPVSCSVSNGPTYKFDVSGAARLPQLNWNFTKLSFGKVFVYQPGMKPPTRILEIANEDVEQVSLQAVLPQTDVFAIDFKDTTIQPGQVLQIPISFTPTDAQAYAHDIAFSINSQTTQTVRISGTGTTLRLMVNKLPQRVLDFGSLVVGDVAERTVDVCNRSAIPVEFAAMGNLANLDALNVHLSPMKVMQLKPGETTPLTFVFAPRERLPPFSEKINAECAGQITALMEVRGACQGVQLEMDNDQLAFGSVNVHSRSVKRVLLSNSGDIGAKFQWKLPKAAQKWFTLAPEKGYLSPGLEVIMLVTFHPNKTMSDCRFEGIKCEVEGGASLNLDLVGSGSPQKAASDQLSFSQAVRTSETKTVKIENKTAHPYDISPIMEHEYFTGASNIVVEAGQTKLYEVTYTPLSMNQGQGGSRGHSKDDAHSGSLFFALPDGNTLMYSLVGHAGSPKHSGQIIRDVPCKVPYTEALPVTNWLGKPQRFKMSIKLIKPSSLDGATKIEGLDYIDVPGHSTRDYKLNFYAFREGTTQCEIHLKNETSGEYLFYEVTFKATAAGVLDTVQLNTCVRSVARHTVNVSNPLPTPVTVSMTCAYLPEPGQKASGTLQCSDIHGPASIRLPGGSKHGGMSVGKYTFDFLPLIEGRRKARLTLQCAELGSFQYDLVLNATPHGPLPVENFSACLGETITHNYKFTNYATVRGEYQISVDNSAFSVPSTVSTIPSSKPTDVEFEVSYEPSQLGSVKAMMTISSKTGGVYTCPLFGECALPRPSGPYVLKAGYSTKIPFKNIFNETTDFTYTIDNSAFTLLKQKDTCKTKESKDVVVKYQDDSKEGVVRSARLVIAAANGPHIGAKWVFYISGVPI